MWALGPCLVVQFKKNIDTIPKKKKEILDDLN